VLHDRMAAIETATEDLTEELSRPPTPQELAAHLNMPVEDVLETLSAQVNRRPLGLDTPLRSDEDEDGATPEWIGDVDGGYELVEDRLTVEAALPSLDEREREVLKLRFVDELPQSQIAREIGCSQMHVSRLLRKTLQRLREQTEVGAGGPAID
jgi:RNA polymerase sigma-B factor